MHTRGHRDGGGRPVFRCGRWRKAIKRFCCGPRFFPSSALSSRLSTSPAPPGLLSEHYDKHPVFILKDVKFKELKAMMDYMYRGEVNISQDQLAALLKAAESLQIKGLSESKTGGSSKTDSSRQQKVVPQTTPPSSSDIPHASSGLTIEKNKVPRQGMAQGSVGDLPEDSASPQIPKGLSSREGSQSPLPRKRKRYRRRSVGEDNSVENHEASNSSDMPQQMGVPALGIAPVADEKTHADPTDSIGRSALMTQLTKPADEMLQLPLEKPEPNDSLIEPKSEYLEDQEESVEDLTLDDDMNDLNEMEQDNNRAGPSHDPSQHPGIGAWHVTGDRSNAGGVVGSVAGAPGTTDEVFLAAQEAAQAHRDSQGENRSVSGINTFSCELLLIRMVNRGVVGRIDEEGRETLPEGDTKKSLLRHEIKKKDGKVSKVRRRCENCYQKNVQMFELPRDSNIGKYRCKFCNCPHSSESHLKLHLTRSCFMDPSFSMKEGQMTNRAYSRCYIRPKCAVFNVVLLTGVSGNRNEYLDPEHLKRQHVCDYCYKSFTHLRYLSKHRNNHCSMYFPTSQGFHYRMDPYRQLLDQPQHNYRRVRAKQGSNDNNDRYNCPKCERSYRHMHHMLRHCKFECGSPPRFQCPYCGMRSKQSNNVYKHIRIKHPGLKLEIVVLHYDQQ
ncbi:Longitudinals lacking protein, isoforms H/M/V [Habropoda laboriosa]|uniref:Longitudinals lacking protein, isoforms H/M/V n=1 Tax=Habropoda laboriosa TaxID=597456 RepID=A0A0L7RAS7_9HYME|nr:Longitudinals lacking protein, isoforms H/M/V [Habropoda laboriosa]